MLCNGWPKGPQIPLPQDAIARLHERANELRQMAASTDEPRLHRLADRYGKVAMRRSLSVADRQCLVEACREEIESRTAYSVPGRPPNQAPTPAALAMAAHAIGRQFVFADTSANPAIRSAIIKLAHLITAYGMVSNAPEMAVRETKGIERAAPSDQHLLLVDDAADVLVSVGAFLVNAGFVVRKIASGDEALAIIAGLHCNRRCCLIFSLRCVEQRLYHGDQSSLSERLGEYGRLRRKRTKAIGVWIAGDHQGLQPRADLSGLSNQLGAIQPGHRKVGHQHRDAWIAEGDRRRVGERVAKDAGVEAYVLLS